MIKGNYNQVTTNISAMQSKLGLMRSEVMRSNLSQTVLDHTTQQLREVEQLIDSTVSSLENFIKTEKGGDHE